MASNTTLNAGSGGDVITTKERTHDGDATKQQGVFVSGVTGSEGSYTFVDVAAGGGVESAALRVTIASDSTGVLSVDDNGSSLTVDNAGLTELAAAINASSQLDVNIAASNATVAVSHAALTALSGAIKAEDAGHSTGDTGITALTVRQDTAAALAGTDADYQPLITDASGRLHVNVGNTVTVASHAVTNAGTFAVQVDAAIPAGTNNIGDVDIASIAAGDNNIGNVDIVTMPNVTLAAGTNTNEVVGDVAHDAAAAGNPVAVAARATNSVEGLTQVAAADATYVTADLNGCLVIRPHTTLEEIITERVTDTGGTSTNFTNFAAGGAGVHNYVTSITVWNSSSTDGFVDIRDGSAGSVLATIPAPQTGGAHVTFPVPLKGGANTALAYDVSAAITTVYITVVGFQAQG